MQEIVDSFYRDYVSPNGLALLGKGDGENDNGILFLGIFVMLMHDRNLLTELDITRSFNAIKGIEIYPGLFARTHLNDKMDSHDNSVGVCALSVIFNFAFARQLVEYGTQTGFCYNNLHPGDFEARAARQGGDIAFYKICAGYTPTIWETVWLCVGILIAAFSGWSSTVNLAWLRLRSMDISIETKPATAITKTALFITNLVYNVCIWKRFGGIKGSFKQYFKAEHPINLLAETL